MTYDDDLIEILEGIVEAVTTSLIATGGDVPQAIGLLEQASERHGQADRAGLRQVHQATRKGMLQAVENNVLALGDA